MKIEILMTANCAYLQPLCVCIASLLDHHRAEDLSLTLVLRDETGTGRQLLDEFLSTFSDLTYQIKPPLIDDNTLPDRLYFSRDMYERFAAADHLPEADKILYLDCDCVVRGDLTPLYTTDISAYYLAACPIPAAVNMGELCDLPKAPYFNSGMMLINAVKWRAVKARERLIHTARDAAPYLRFPDQDALNLLFHRNWLQLSPIWNAIRPYFIGSENHGLSREEMLSIAAKAVVIHYNSRFKPWHYSDNHPCKDLYWHYLRQTPFHDFTPSDKTLAAQIRKGLLALMPQALKAAVKRLTGYQDHGNDPQVNKPPQPLRHYFLDQESPPEG